MNALMPRLLGDLTGWFDTDLPIRSGHLIRVEDTLTDTEYLVRAELPGMDAGKDIAVTVEDGLLTISAERREEEKVHGRSEFRYGKLQRAVRLPANARDDVLKQGGLTDAGLAGADQGPSPALLGARK